MAVAFGSSLREEIIFREETRLRPWLSQHGIFREERGHSKLSSRKKRRSSRVTAGRTIGDGETVTGEKLL